MWVRPSELYSFVLRAICLEAWRRLKDEYEGRSGNRLAAVLRGILNPSERWNRDKEFLESQNDWEILIGEYRAASGENVSDRVLIATILEHAPSRYQDILRANPAQQKKNYPALRRWIKDYCESSRIYGESGIAGGPVPMDVARSKAISLARARRARARTESRMASMSKERSSPRRGQATRRVEATYRLQRSFRATVATARNGDINELTVVKSASALPEFEFCKRAQVATVTYSEEQSKEKDDRWCFALVTDSKCQAVKGSVLIDSGSDEHVCRKEFAPAYETQPDPHSYSQRCSKGSSSARWGARRLSSDWSIWNYCAQCAFKVAAVNDDVLSLEGFFDEGSSLILVWDADVLYHHFSTTIACGFRLFLRYVRSRIATSGDGDGSRRRTTR